MESLALVRRGTHDDDIDVARCGPRSEFRRVAGATKLIAGERELLGKRVVFVPLANEEKHLGTVAHCRASNQNSDPARCGAAEPDPRHAPPAGPDPEGGAP